MEIEKFLDIARGMLYEESCDPIFWEDNWEVKVSKRLRTCYAVCDHDKKEIRFSHNYVVSADESSLVETMLHEMAHASCGCGEGHNKVWKQVYIAMGGNGSIHGKDMPFKWSYDCVSCGNIARRSNRIKKYKECCCIKCDGKLEEIKRF